MEFTPIIAVFVSFLITALLGKITIPFLHKLKFGQTIREDGPKWHASKSGTPTMGGIMMIIGFVASFLVTVSFSLISKNKVYGELQSAFKAIPLFAGFGLALGMGAIGFVDDYIKVVKKRNLGLTAKQKTIMQAIVSAAYLSSLALGGLNSTYIPFYGYIDVNHGLGLIFWPIAFFFVYGFTNAVNLTDGIDGLASSVTLIVSCLFMLVAGISGFFGFNMFAAALAGACAAFLIWNIHPAKVFMGDTGSMFLGGAVTAMAFGVGKPVILIAAGIVYLCEALSVVLQVAYFKKTGKRLFNMSPVHHHFELCGWSENKIVFNFSLVTIAGCIVAALPTLLNK